MVNAMLVERIEAVPDTVITLTTGNTYVVREGVDEVVERSVQYLRSLRGPEEDATPVTTAQWGRIV